jgi:hypothetical protein
MSSREMGRKEESIVYAVAILITLALFGLFGWWALSWSTHTLVWLSFMGLSLGSAGARIKVK